MRAGKCLFVRSGCGAHCSLLAGSGHEDGLVDGRRPSRRQGLGGRGVRAWLWQTHHPRCGKSITPSSRTSSLMRRHLGSRAFITSISAWPCGQVGWRDTERRTGQAMQAWMGHKCCLLMPRDAAFPSTALRCKGRQLHALAAATQRSWVDRSACCDQGQCRQRCPSMSAGRVLRALRAAESISAGCLPAGCRRRC